LDLSLRAGVLEEQVLDPPSNGLSSNCAEAAFADGGDGRKERELASGGDDLN